MESSIFPVPSEIVIPPAAFLATQGRFNVWGVIARRHVWFVAGGQRDLLGLTLARAHRDREMGPLFHDQRSEINSGRAMAASLRGGRDFFCATASRDSASHLDPGRYRSNEFRHFQCNDDCRLSSLVLDSRLVWTDGDHSRDVDAIRRAWP